MKKIIIILTILASGNSIANENDPFETVNRSIFKFNSALDQNVLVPIANNYREYTPELVQNGVTNFFNNLGEIPTFFNQFLQLKIGSSLNTLFRFGVNSTFGIGGLIDIMSEEGLKRANEDFGQTLGYYGVPSGPYLVLPILGPSSLRDITQIPVDSRFRPDLKMNSDQNIATNVVNVVNTRANLLNTTRILYDSDDAYIKFRSSYLQNRDFQVKDGNLDTDDIDF